MPSAQPSKGRRLTRQPVDRRRWLQAFFALALLGCVFSMRLIAGVTPLDPPTLGMWYDPSHNGHGFDLQRQGDTWFLVFYTYNEMGEPIWFIATGTLDGDTLSMDLLRVTYDAQRDPPQQVAEVAGQITLSFGTQGQAPCADAADLELALMSWTLGADSGVWCVQPLRVSNGFPDADFSGHWFAGELDPGWGMTFYFQGDVEGAADNAFILLYYYDANGDARWGIAVPDSVANAGQATLETIGGYCVACPVSALTSQPSGDVNYQFGLNDGQIEAAVSLDVSFAGTAGGDWLRDEQGLFLLSDPAPGLLPLPQTIDAAQRIAIVDVDVISMRDDNVLGRQTVLVEDGVISGIGPVSEVQIPADAQVLDGRRRLLMPGLADMHTHLTVGGTQRAIDRNGLVSILAGVTTSLNMGDGIAGGMVPIRDRWLSGAAIGPYLYLGKTAFGPNDNALRDYDVNTPATIDTAQRAQQYAQSIATQDYDFIKIYNTLSTTVVNVLHSQGASLGLPVIGHTPKNFSFTAGMDAGQVMIAHIAEVYFTHFGNNIQPQLLESAAEAVASRGVFQSATISTSEVFAGLYGGNQANFNAYIQRQGAQYLDPAVFQFWQSAFNGGLYTPAGAQPGQLDARFAFFKDIVNAMQEGGALLLGGSDAPAHPGLVPGFAIHDELRVMRDAGLSNFEALSTVTRNPGQFIDETLAPTISFGTVEVGKRADLLLLDDNPLLDYRSLDSQVGVLLRGTWYSQQHLQSLAEQPPVLSKSAWVIIDPEPHPDSCAHHSRRPLMSRLPH